MKRCMELNMVVIMIIEAICMKNKNIMRSVPPRCGKTISLKHNALQKAKGQQKVLLHEELLGRPIQ